MASIRIWTSWNDQIDCREFTDVDPDVSGIELTRDANEYLGRMIDVTIPDEEDNKGMSKFIDGVENWMIDNDH